MLRYFLSLLFLSILLNFGSSEKLPPFVKTCQISDPNLKSCLKDSMESLRPYLKSGIRRFKIPTLDPLFITSFRHGTPQLNSTFTDVNVYNTYNFNIIDMEVDPTNLSLNVTLNLKNVSMVSNYVAFGEMLGLKLDGFGVVKFQYDDVDAKINVKCDRTIKNEKVHLTLKELHVNIIPKKLAIFAENIVNGNPELSKHVNELINENVLDFFAVGGPTFNGVAENVIKSIITYVFEKWTFKELLDV